MNRNSNLSFCKFTLIWNIEKCHPEEKYRAMQRSWIAGTDFIKQVNLTQARAIQAHAFIEEHSTYKVTIRLHLQLEALWSIVKNVSGLFY